MPTSSMPRTVAWFERLAYAAIALTALAIPMNSAAIGPYFEKSPIAVIVSIVVPTLGLPILGVWLVARKQRNWARWLFLVYVAMGVLGLIMQYGKYKFPMIVQTLNVAGGFLRCVAVALLFTRSAKPWFLSPSNVPHSDLGPDVEEPS